MVLVAARNVLVSTYSAAQASSCSFVFFSVLSLRGSAGERVYFVLVLCFGRGLETLCE
jgi:hypothetical protein